MNLYEYVELQPEGYYCLLPEYRKNMKQFYQDEYYQNEGGNYSLAYEDCELEYFRHEAEEMECMFFANWGGYATNHSQIACLELGCGEGYALNYFSESGYQVTGIDYSIFGIEHNNPQLINAVVQGDIYQQIDKMMQRKQTFDFVYANNVLEHVDDAELLFEKIRKVCNEQTLISIRVPNDFSILQEHLFEEAKIDRPFWVTYKTGEHNYYFSYDSLRKLGEKMGFSVVDAYADFPIDCFLFDEDTNYVINKSVGHRCYLAKIEIENLLYNQSMEEALNLHRAYIRAGIGRDITVVFRRNTEK